MIPMILIIMIVLFVVMTNEDIGKHSPDTEPEIRHNPNSLFLYEGEPHNNGHHIEIKEPYYIKELIKKYGIKKSIDVPLNSRGHDSRFGLRKLILNNGIIVKPVRIYEKNYDGSEDSSYVELHFLAGVEYLDIDVLIRGTNTGNGMNGSGHSNTQAWFYDSSSIYTDVEQLGILKIQQLLK